MTDTITIKKPFDAHVHLRRGAILRAVTKYTAKAFDKAIVMPNTEPPVDTLDAAIEYKNEILAAPGVGNFEPLMTLYLTKNLTPQEIDSLLAQARDVEKASACPHGRPTTLRMTLKDLERQFRRT